MVRYSAVRSVRFSFLVVFAGLLTAAVTGCGRVGMKYSVDQAGKALDVVLASPCLDGAPRIAAEDAKKLIDGVQKDVGLPPEHLRKEYTHANASEALRLAEEERRQREEFKAMIYNLAMSYLPGAGLLGLIPLLLKKSRENGILKEAVSVAVGSIETASTSAEAKKQVQGAQNEAIEAAVRALKVQRAQSPTDPG